MEHKQYKSRSRPLVGSRRREKVLVSDRCFSLVELLVATLVFSIGVVAVAHLLVLSVHKHQLGRNTSDAAHLAAAKIEELAKLNFATAPAVQITAAGADPLAENVANYFDTPAGGYTRRWRVDAGPNADTRTVTLRLVPPVNHNLTYRQVELTTVLRRW